MTVIAGPWPPPTDGQLLAGRVHAGRLDAGTPELHQLTQPLTVTLRPDTAAAFEALTTALLKFGAALTAAAAASFDQLARALGAGRWRTDGPPRRWRDWQPADERPVDRARRQRLDRQLRQLHRRAARRARRGGAA